MSAFRNAPSTSRKRTFVAFCVQWLAKQRNIQRNTDSVLIFVQKHAFPKRNFLCGERTFVLDPGPKFPHHSDTVKNEPCCSVGRLYFLWIIMLHRFAYLILGSGAFYRAGHTLTQSLGESMSWPLKLPLCTRPSGRSILWPELPDRALRTLGFLIHSSSFSSSSLRIFSGCGSSFRFADSDEQRERSPTPFRYVYQSAVLTRIIMLTECSEPINTKII